ncbi:hypothetical protein [Dyella agri]|uniref:Uncharacterized protein n=1 Tax=Dyella agri TaxID=1926869 RepID=A0ABW8KIB4_9GAMM
MKERITKGLFSLSGASIMIGVVGFMSGIVTIFINVNQQLSVKWLLLALLIGISLTLILLKVIFDLSQEIRPPPPYEHPIRYVAEEQVFVIRRNDNFLNNIVVGCYAQMNEIDRLAYLGVVHLIQDRVIQVKIQNDYSVLSKIPSTQEELRNIIIRPVVPVTALQQMGSLESTNV